MSNNLSPVTTSGASPTGSAQHETATVEGNCNVTVTNEKGFRSYEALHADHGEKARGQFTKLVEIRADGKKGVQRYWMSPGDAAAYNIRRLMPSKTTVSK